MITPVNVAAVRDVVSILYEYFLLLDTVGNETDAIKVHLYF